MKIFRKHKKEYYKNKLILKQTLDNNSNKLVSNRDENNIIEKKQNNFHKVENKNENNYIAKNENQHFNKKTKKIYNKNNQNDSVNFKSHNRKIHLTVKEENEKKVISKQIKKKEDEKMEEMFLGLIDGNI